MGGVTPNNRAKKNEVSIARMAQKAATKIWRVLEDLGKRIWVLLLPLTMLSLIFVILTYCSQRASNRPKLGTAPIIGSGQNVMPGFGGNVDMSLNAKAHSGQLQFLLCATYFDEAGERYDQSFVLKKDDESSSAINSQLKEIAPFGSDLCHTIQGSP
jgi:hypothetical protein